MLWQYFLRLRLSLLHTYSMTLLSSLILTSLNQLERARDCMLALYSKSRIHKHMYLAETWKASNVQNVWISVEINHRISAVVFLLFSISKIMGMKFEVRSLRWREEQQRTFRLIRRCSIWSECYHCPVCHVTAQDVSARHCSEVGLAFYRT